LVSDGSGEKGGRGGTNLSNKTQNIQHQPEVRAIHTADSLEGDLAERAALLLPRGTEANMRQANRTPGKQRGQPRQRQQPIKHRRTIRIQVDIGQRAKRKQHRHRQERPTRAINIRKDLGRVPLLRKRRERARAAVHSRDADREHRDEDDDVHERVEALEVGVLADQDKGRGVDVGIGVRAEQVGVVVRDQQADEEQAEDVEERDTPKDLLDGAGEGLEGVLGFGGGLGEKKSVDVEFEGKGGSIDVPDQRAQCRRMQTRP